MPFNQTKLNYLQNALFSRPRICSLYLQLKSKTPLHKKSCPISDGGVSFLKIWIVWYHSFIAITPRFTLDQRDITFNLWIR